MAQPQIFISDEEYLAFERASETRHEYLDGRIYAMAGESPEHSVINANVTAILVTRLRGKGCRTFSPNMKVQTSRSGL
ncbi:MAG: Uma2 family endonuclease, partial [Acidobacteriota bacterium]